MEAAHAHVLHGARVEVDDDLVALSALPDPELPLEVVVDVEILREVEAVRGGSLGIAHAVEQEGPDLSTFDVEADAVDGVAVEHHRVRMNRDPLFGFLPDAAIE